MDNIAFSVVMKRKLDADEMLAMCILKNTESIKKTQDQLDLLVWMNKKYDNDLAAEKLEAQKSQCNRQIVNVLEERILIRAAEYEPRWTLYREKSLVNICYAFENYKDDISPRDQHVWKLETSMANALIYVLRELFPKEDFGTNANTFTFLEGLAVDARKVRDYARGIALSFPDEQVDKNVGPKFVRWLNALKITKTWPQFKDEKLLKMKRLY